MVSSKVGLYRAPILQFRNNGEAALYEDFQVCWLENGQVYRLTVCKGFVFNGVSNPPILWTLTRILPWSIDTGAAAGHDALYQCMGMIRFDDKNLRLEVLRSGTWDDGAWDPMEVDWHRDQCDDWFRMVMLMAGENRFKADLMTNMVRIFGGIAWHRT